jgi:hypothetical protein
VTCKRGSPPLPPAQERVKYLRLSRCCTQKKSRPHATNREIQSGPQETNVDYIARGQRADFHSLRYTLATKPSPRGDSASCCDRDHATQRYAPNRENVYRRRIVGSLG